MPGGARNAIREYCHYQSAQVKVTFGHPPPLLLLFISNPSLHRRKKPTVKEPSSKQAKHSPAVIPLTPDVPTPSVRIDIDMEDAGGQFDPMPKANPMTEAAANDVVQSEKASGLFQGQVADVLAGAVYFGDKSNLKSSTLFPARKMPVTSCPVASPLSLREQPL
jgi:hypothetical protein